jgi:molecular chaperone GrpE
MTDERREGEEQQPTPEGQDSTLETAATEPEGAEAAAGANGEAEPQSAAGPVDESTAQLAALQAELEALNDRHLRLAAEFDNYRKRIERERAELWTRAQAELVTRLLEVLDDLQRVGQFEAETTSAAALLEGAQLVEKKMRHILESAGLEPIEAEGEFFNPSTMEALLTVPTERQEEDDQVAEVFQKGYRFRGILIRPARVRVKKYEG